MPPPPIRPDSPPAPGKITQDLVTPELVEQRARELALIAGRSPAQVNDTDRAEALQELLGNAGSKLTADDEPQAGTGIWEAPPTSTGHQAPKQLPRDDQISRELVEEGVDEAEHDQMVRGSRMRK